LQQESIVKQDAHLIADRKQKEKERARDWNPTVPFKGNDLKTSH
jgi:hypothetical protein